MDANERRASREEAMAIKAEVDYQRLVSRIVRIVAQLRPPASVRRGGRPLWATGANCEPKANLYFESALSLSQRLDFEPAKGPEIDFGPPKANSEPGRPWSGAPEAQFGLPVERMSFCIERRFWARPQTNLAQVAAEPRSV